MTQNINGLGSDIIEIERVKKILEKYSDIFLKKIFTPTEIAHIKTYLKPAPHIAGRFAAKEAIVKALGCGIGAQIAWHDIEIKNNSLGKPEVFLSTKANKKFSYPTFLLTLSHCRYYAIAVAMVNKN